MGNKTLMYLAILLVLMNLLILSYLHHSTLKKELANASTENILIKNKTIVLSSLTIQQKLAQMIIVRGDGSDVDYTKLNIGGIFLDKQKEVGDYKKIIEEYQKQSTIPLIVATDLEGAWTPFAKANITFPHFNEITSAEEARKIGEAHGRLLKETGFTMNFAPVAEYTDDAYGGRTFSGTKDEIQEKLTEYIGGLQQYVPGVCKHYPGKGMIANLHFRADTQEITQDDIDLFETCIRANITGIMVSHQKTTGKFLSDKPSSISKQVIDPLKEKEILIVADEINMRGLSTESPNKKQRYVELINAGEELILDFKLSPIKTQALLNQLEKEVEKGTIKEEQLDRAVARILTHKGYMVKP